jgi:hypothetical protein
VLNTNYMHDVYAERDVDIRYQKLHFHYAGPTNSPVTRLFNLATPDTLKPLPLDPTEEARALKIAIASSVSPQLYSSTIAHSREVET